MSTDLDPAARALIDGAREDSEQLRRLHVEEEDLAKRRRAKWMRAKDLDRKATLGRIAEECGLSEPFVTKQVRLARKENGSPSVKG
jgi:hypothetical protein